MNKENIVSNSSDEFPSTSKKRKLTGSMVWDHFKKSNEGKQAQCRHCDKKYKTSGGTSNLMDHLRRAHPSLHFYEKPANSICKFFKAEDHYATCSVRKQNLDQALMKMIATDVQPFSIVEDAGFRNFVRLLDPRYLIPSRNTLQNVQLKNIYDDLTSKLRIILSKVDQCAITMDGWTSRANDGYLTVTVHFINDIFELKAAVLSTEKLLDPLNHNAENIASSLKAVLSMWNLESKVTAIVTDNASVMIKSCKILEMRHLPCFAHCLNLVVQDCLAQDCIKPILTKCKKIVTFFKSSSIAYAKFKQAQGETAYSLVQEVCTRWNSAYKMVERILATNNYISSVLLSLSRAPEPLTADDIALLTDIKSILAPFDFVTTQCSSSSKVTISSIVPLSNGLVQGLIEQHDKLNTPYGKEACLFLQKITKERLYPFEARSTTRLATLLDPRFKKEGFRSPNNADQAAMLLEETLTSYFYKNCSGEDAVQAENAQDNNKGEPLETAEESLLKFVSSNIQKKKRTKRVDAILVQRQYFEKMISAGKCDPLEYWRSNESEHPELAALARNTLCVPATSTESERMFSKAGQIISDRRANLKPKIVDKLLFINKNWWINDC